MMTTTKRKRNRQQRRKMGEGWNALVMLACRTAAAEITRVDVQTFQSKGIMKKLLVASIMLFVAALLAACRTPEPAAETVQVVAEPQARRRDVGSLGLSGEVGKENDPPTYVGAEVCELCHREVYDRYAQSGHNLALNPVVNGQPPEYPFSEIPSPPEGYTWDDVAYVVGGYNWKARFVGQDGFLITGDANSATQYNLHNADLDLGDQWVPYHSGEELAFDCGRCHTTGYRPDGNQAERPGLRGTWAADGVQCEACHGAGSRHVESPLDVPLTSNQDASLCQTCHTAGNLDQMEAGDGFVLHHDRTDSPLAAKKQNLGCVGCHDPHQGVVAAQEKQQPTTHTPCETCHLDKASPRADQLHPTVVECVDCHMPQLIKSAVGDAAAFTGDLRTHLLQIQPAAGQFSEDGGTSMPYISLDFACRQCHVEKTDNELIAAATDYDHQGPLHSLEVSAGVDCFQCHGPTDWADVTVNPRVHELVGYPLTGSHAELACSQCHTDTFTETSGDCMTCHAQDEPHEGQLGQNCAQCHTPEGWQEATFDHAQAAIRLVGFHIGLDCSQCHSDLTFQGTPQTCYACHAGRAPHSGQFGPSCEQCHTPNGWRQVTFNHSQAAFQLVGAHASVSCQQCHSNGVFRGTPQTCYACHAGRDPHGGQFGPSCEQCHTPNGWNQTTFDHSRAAFQLVGAHAGVSCQQCHTSGVFRGTPQDCTSCHAGRDAHGGRFGTNCAQCHTPNGWNQATFDHGLAAFPLTGRHTQVSCAQCHGGGVYLGTPKVCSACHGEPAVHAGLFGTACETCHTTNGWLPAGYNGPHTFPMNHKGANGNCQTCHPSGPPAYTCYGCHDAGKIERKHREEGISDFGNCMACHPTGQEP